MTRWGWAADTLSPRWAPGPATVRRVRPRTDRWRRRGSSQPVDDAFPPAPADAASCGSGPRATCGSATWWCGTTRRRPATMAPWRRSRTTHTVLVRRRGVPSGRPDRHGAWRSPGHPGVHV